MRYSAGIGAAALLSVCVAAAASQDLPRSGRALYAEACASCHGADGRGRTAAEVGFDLPLPDFSDCSFASREPDADWFAVIHEGGPVRAFNRMMPAFAQALSPDEIDRILEHVRTFCADPRWPRGEFNLPKALFTEKAFPEDELVWRSIVNSSGATAITSQLTYEKRFGPRGQLELTAPLSLADRGPGAGTEFGIGDIGIGWKQTLVASLAAGSIFGIGGEVVLPTGDESRGFGSGSTVLEPYLVFGQILPQDAFVQAQLFAEFPLRAHRNDELGWRFAAGRTWAEDNGFGRAWTPMVEILGARELAGGAATQWDVVPQLQVSLSQRQHVLFNAGLRLPLTDSGRRDTQFVFYLLWDWYDGGLTEGW